MIEIQSSCVFFRQTLSVTATRTKVLVGVFPLRLSTLPRPDFPGSHGSEKHYRLVLTYFDSSRRHTRQGRK